MAVIAPVVVGPTADDVIRVTWGPLANGDTGGPISYPNWPDRSVQVTGIFGASGNVRIEGCLEATPTNYATLTDPQGNALDVTAAKIEAVTEVTAHIRPNVTNGDGTTALTVTLLLRRP